MSAIEYTCRFCKTTRTFEADISEIPIAGIKVNLSTWLDNLSCNRCSEFFKAQSKIRSRILSTCYFLTKAREAKPKTLPDIESACKVKLGQFARKFNSLVAGYHCREDLYDDQFGDTLFQRPDAVATCLRIQTNAIIAQPRPDHANRD